MTSHTFASRPLIGLEIAPESSENLLHEELPIPGIDYLALRHRPSSHVSLDELLSLHDRLLACIRIPILLHLPFQRLVNLSPNAREEYCSRLGASSPWGILAIHGDDATGCTISLHDMCHILAKLRTLLPDSYIIIAGHPRAILLLQSRQQEEENLRSKVSCGVDGILTQMLSSPLEYEAYVSFTTETVGTLPVIPGIPLAPTSAVAERFHLVMSNPDQANSSAWTCELAESLALNKPHALHFFGTRSAPDDIHMLKSHVLPRIQHENSEFMQSLNADDT